MSRLMKGFYLSSLLLVVFGVSGCSSVSKTVLSPEGEALEVMHQRPHSHCHVHGKYVGVNEQASVELARNHARNLAARDGSDAIIFDEEIRNAGQWVVHATGYRCR